MKRRVSLKGGLKQYSWSCFETGGRGGVTKYSSFNPSHTLWYTSTHVSSLTKVDKVFQVGREPSSAATQAPLGGWVGSIYQSRGAKGGGCFWPDPLHFPLCLHRTWSSIQPSCARRQVTQPRPYLFLLWSFGGGQGMVWDRVVHWWQGCVCCCPKKVMLGGNATVGQWDSGRVPPHVVTWTSWLIRLLKKHFRPANFAMQIFFKWFVFKISNGQLHLGNW